MIAAEEELLEEVSGLSVTDTAYLKEQAKTDLYLLCLGVLGYKDMQPELHGIGAKFIQNQPKRRRLILWPRAHLKTTEFSVGHSLQLGLADPDNARVLIASETATLAEKILLEIKGHFEKNRVLRSLFPELLPPRFSGPGVTWRNDAASLIRRTAHKEPTWSALGVGGASVGAHYTNIKCDDLIGLEALRSPAAMSRAIQWLDYLEPLLVNQHTDVIDWIGTRWSKTDLYNHLMLNYGDELAVTTRSAIENGQIIFPALHTWEEYERIQRTNPSLWYAQYENNPVSAGKSDFPIESLRTYRFNHDESEVVTQEGKRWQVEELDRVLTADPNSGSLVAPDEAAISVQGVSPDDEVFVLDSWGGRVSPSAFVDEIYRRARRWNVRVVGIEKAGQQNTDHYFQLKMEKEGRSFRVEPLNPQKRHKEDRVRAAVEPLVRSGLLYLLPSQTGLRKQLGDFPDCILWDEVDALAYGPDLWRKGVKREDLERRTDVRKKLMSLRNRITGY